MPLNFGVTKLFRSPAQRAGRPLTDHHIVLVSGMRANPDCVRQLQKLLHRVAEQSREESACLAFDIHQSMVDSDLFFVYQVWQDEASFDDHCHQDYAIAFRKAAPELLEGPVQLHKWKMLL